MIPFSAFSVWDMRFGWGLTNARDKVTQGVVDIDVCLQSCLDNTELPCKSVTYGMTSLAQCTLHDVSDTDAATTWKAKYGVHIYLKRRTQVLTCMLS